MYYIPDSYKDRLIITNYTRCAVVLAKAACLVNAKLVWLCPLEPLAMPGVGLLFETPEDCTLHMLKHGNELTDIEDSYDY